MELRDFIVTPIWLFIIYAVAYWLRPRFTDENTRRYFIPALTVRIIGALAVGFIYQFYYGGGDTFGYHTHGSVIVWQAFKDNMFYGIRLLFAGDQLNLDLYEYTSLIYFYGDFPSYFVIRIATIFDLVTFRTYSATASLFAVLSFSGAWAFYNMFYKKYRNLYKYLAISILFVPTVFFWGSGIFKDTITLSALCWATYSFDQLVFDKRRVVLNSIVLIFTFFVISSIKIYILLCFIPALIVWVYANSMASISNIVVKFLLGPIVFVFVAMLAYWAVLKVGEDDPRYALENIAQTAQVTAYDIAFWTGRDAGSTYTLGDLDGTFESMVRLFPSAVNVSLFRPYIWEVKNPLMFLAALESFIVLMLTLCLAWKKKIFGLFKDGLNPAIFFCLSFSIIFAFAVGVSTYNFGTLMRYKIPLMPFYLSAIMILLHNNKESTNTKVSGL